ncbi:MAG: hypothetical protein EA381_16280 [Planctomycetaceae bacterium]|nr:MAG: hypothetical protein EA381_16280 [Planctomycetaceae bacterium]
MPLPISQVPLNQYTKTQGFEATLGFVAFSEVTQIFFSFLIVPGSRVHWAIANWRVVSVC